MPLVHEIRLGSSRVKVSGSHLELSTVLSDLDSPAVTQIRLKINHTPTISKSQLSELEFFCELLVFQRLPALEKILFTCHGPEADFPKISQTVSDMIPARSTARRRVVFERGEMAGCV